VPWIHSGSTYAQDLADKLSRDCRRIVASDWYQRLFPTRLSPKHQAVAEFETTAQGCRVRMLSASSSTFSVRQLPRDFVGGE
jgi:hypothetical protein